MLRSDRDATKQQNANREIGAINIEHNPSVLPPQVLCHCHHHPLLGISFHQVIHYKQTRFQTQQITRQITHIGGDYDVEQCRI